MDAAGALDYAAEHGVKVRGDAARAVAGASLVLHASRTLDPRPFLGRAPLLPTAALAAFNHDGRDDLALRVHLWMSDAAASAGKAPPEAAKAYEQAREWAAGKGGVANLAWIRGVPRDEVGRQIIAERLLEHALAAKPRSPLAAQAAVEAMLADFPRRASYSTLFRAAVLAGTAEVFERTRSGLGVVHPKDDTPDGRAMLGQLHAALDLAQMEADGTPIEDAAQRHMADLTRERALSTAPLSAHLGAALLRAGRKDLAMSAMEASQQMAAGLPRPMRTVAVACAYVSKSAEGAEGKQLLGVGAPLLQLPRGESAGAVDLIEGASEATRALRDPWPAVDAAQSVGGESMGPMVAARTRGALFKRLIETAGTAAAVTGDLEAVRAMARVLAITGLPVLSETYLRAHVADAAAGVAARSGNHEAWEFAGRLAARGPGAFERAKMRGRFAFEFIRAGQVPAPPQAWLDPLFPAPLVVLQE